MTGIEASASPPPLPRWFGPRASPDDPAISALIDRVAGGAGWADIGGAFNLNVRIDAEPPVVLRVHRPWVRRGRVAGLRRLRERLQRTQMSLAGWPAGFLIRLSTPRGKVAPCSPADPSPVGLVGHCHDRNRSFDLSPYLAAVVRTESEPG